MVLIDTSVWLFALKKNFHPIIKDRIENLLLTDEVAINGLIRLELLGGARTEVEYRRLEERLDSLYYIAATKPLWDTASKLAFDLRREGITAPHTDIFIAASALKENALLLHADAHFDLVSKHCGLKVESLASFIHL